MLDTPKFNIQTVKEIPEYLKLLLYGPMGVGKTTWSAEAPNPVHIDLERSTEVLRNTPYEDNAVFVPKDKAEFKKFVFSLPKMEFETAIIDTVSQQQDIHLYEDMVELEKKSGGRRSRYLALFQEYRISTEEMKEIFRFLQQADINVIAIAHSRVYTENSDDTATRKVVAIRPDLTPRVADAIERLPNVVAYMEKTPPALNKPASRKLYVNSTKTIAAKNRYRIQETYLENISLKELMNYGKA